MSMATQHETHGVGVVSANQLCGGIKLPEWLRSEADHLLAAGCPFTKACGLGLIARLGLACAEMPASWKITAVQRPRTPAQNVAEFVRSWNATGLAGDFVTELDALWEVFRALVTALPNRNSEFEMYARRRREELESVATILRFLGKGSVAELLGDLDELAQSHPVLFRNIEAPDSDHLDAVYHAQPDAWWGCENS